MSWKIVFFSDSVEKDILDMPPKIQARMIWLLETMESHGPNLGPPHTKAMKDGLFEIRAKAQEGIARALFCYIKQKRIVILHAFIKKSTKTPKKELDIALHRKKEVENEQS